MPRISRIGRRLAKALGIGQRVPPVERVQKIRKKTPEQEAAEQLAKRQAKRAEDLKRRAEEAKKRGGIDIEA